MLKTPSTTHQRARHTKYKYLPHEEREGEKRRWKTHDVVGPILSQTMMILRRERERYECKPR